MPIVGLTDQQPVIGGGLPRIATLYKGDEKPAEGNRPGRDLKYFRVEFEPQFEALRDLWSELYDQEPKEFSPVFLAAPTVEEAFSTWMEEWTATAMLHRCDGEHQVAWYDKQTGNYARSRVKCAAPECGCKRTGRLNLIFEDLVEASGILGYVAVTTHSLHDIITLHRYLSDIEGMYGRLTGVPFVFGRADREVSAPHPKKKGERMKTTKSLLYIHVAPDFAKSAILPTLRGHQSALPASAMREPMSEEAVERARAHLSGSDVPKRLVGQASDPEVREGEYEETPAWTEQEAVDFTSQWRKHSLTDVDLREALGITSWRDWTGTRAEADAVINAWLNEQLTTVL